MISRLSAFCSCSVYRHRFDVESMSILIFMVLANYRGERSSNGSIASERLTIRQEKAYSLIFTGIEKTSMATGISIVDGPTTASTSIRRRFDEPFLTG